MGQEPLPSIHLLDCDPTLLPVGISQLGPALEGAPRGRGGESGSRARCLNGGCNTAPTLLCPEEVGCCPHLGSTAMSPPLRTAPNEHVGVLHLGCHSGAVTDLALDSTANLGAYGAPH